MKSTFLNVSVYSIFTSNFLILSLQLYIATLIFKIFPQNDL